MEQKPVVVKKESTYVAQIVSEHNKAAEKKAQKKENMLLTFVMKAVSRDQQNNLMISKLKNELQEKSDNLNLLIIENEVKDSLINLKDKELESLKSENANLRKSLIELETKPNPEPVKQGPIAICNDNCNNEVISTFSNIIASPSKLAMGIEDDEATSNNVVSTTSHPSDAPAKSVLTKRRSLKRSNKDTAALASILYNLRKRNKAK